MLCNYSDGIIRAWGEFSLGIVRCHFNIKLNFAVSLLTMLDGFPSGLLMNLFFCFVLVFVDDRSIIAMTTIH